MKLSAKGEVGESEGVCSGVLGVESDCPVELQGNGEGGPEPFEDHCESTGGMGAEASGSARDVGDMLVVRER